MSEVAQMLKDLESAKRLIFNVEQKNRKQGFDKISHSLFLTRANLNDAIYDLKKMNQLRRINNE